MNESRPPVCGVARNPLVGLMPCDMRPIEIGTPLYELMPDGEVVLCRYNGDWLLHEDYAIRVRPGDVVEWHEMPQGKDTLRGVIGIAIAVGAAVLGQEYGVGYGLAFAFGANLALNALLPPALPQVNAAAAAGSLYSTSLQGNQGRLNQPIWKVCGRRKITPPFAGMPYQEYVDKDGTDVDNDQYYFAVFAASLGNVDLEASLIGATHVSHFQDVTVAQMLAPGTPPSTAQANVQTSTDVASNTLESGHYVGGFTACSPQRTCSAIGIDIECPRGITQSLSWQVEIREVNDFGIPVTGWSVLATQSRTGSTNTPQRWSYKYPLATPYRAEIRCVRTDIKNTDPAALHEVAWVGLRGYLGQAATLDPDTTHFEVVMRASAQLSQYSQRNIALIVHGKCRTWSSGGGWGAEVYTRNPGWWLLDLASSSVWGLAEPDARIDLQGFADFAATCDLRQDHFDYTFDTAMAAWDAMQLIARAGRARVFRRNGVLTIARDELETLPVTAFTSRNTVPDSMTTVETLPQREQADGFIVQYEDFRTWAWTPIECPCPGVISMAAPVVKQIPGITGPTQALREGLYEAANLLYRTRVVSCKTEMEGVIPAFMAPVTWQPDIVGYGQSGDVAFWNPATLVMGLTEPPAWGAADLYLRLRRDNGSLTTQVKVTPGPTANDIVLPAAPDFTLVIDDGTRERPMFVLGPQVGGDELAKVVSIQDGGKGSEGEQLYTVNGIIDDARVHAADNAYLPGPGDIQDPITLDTGIDDDTGGDILALIQLHDLRLTQGGFLVFPTYLSYSLNNTGVVLQNGMYGTSGDTPVFNDWAGIPITPTLAATYEVRATEITLPAQIGGSALGTWLNLGTTRKWTLDITDIVHVAVLDTPAVMTVEIRKVGSTIVQETRTITMIFFTEYSA